MRGSVPTLECGSARESTLQFQLDSLLFPQTIIEHLLCARHCVSAGTLLYPCAVALRHVSQCSAPTDRPGFLRIDPSCLYFSPGC